MDRLLRQSTAKSRMTQAAPLVHSPAATPRQPDTRLRSRLPSADDRTGPRRNGSSVRHVDTRWTVETPEGVDFHFELAGPGRRGLARLIDLLLISLMVIALSLLLTILQMLPGLDGPGMGAMLLGLFVIQWLYSALFEALTGGRTPGKMCLQLRVVRTNGTPITFFEAFGRGLLHSADILPATGTVAVISMCATPRLQRLGDVFFDTMVIDEGIVAVGRETIIDRSLPPLSRSCCTRGFRLPERTLTAIERLFERHRPISMYRREELAWRLANPVAALLGYRPELDEHRMGGVAVKPVQSGKSNDGFPATLFLLRVHVTFSGEMKSSHEDATLLAPVLASATPSSSNQPAGDIHWIGPESAGEGP